MAGPAPKPPGQRRRRNLDAPRWRTLPAAGRTTAGPALPRKRPAWTAATRAWWKRLWRSPMATVYVEADWGALFRLAYLFDDFSRGELSSAGLAEMRRLEDLFGLSPKSRQMLQWQILGSGELEQKREASTRPTQVRRLRAVDPGSTSSAAG